MKYIMLFVMLIVCISHNQICFSSGHLHKNEKVNIIRVPTDFPSIAQAVAHAKNGDYIVLAPGSYYESEIKIDKRIVITSEWKLYNIHHNMISKSNSAGIQLISYDIFTEKEFNIHHNIIKECKVGLGCMEGTNTKENLNGASTMDELIYFYNNTLFDNQIGATGGNSVYAMNNVVFNNKSGGFKRFGNKSVVVNNLFYQNGNNNFVELNEHVILRSNRFEVEPLLNVNTFVPLTDSPCIDAGEKYLDVNGKRVLIVSDKDINGNMPDLGAIEYK